MDKSKNLFNTDEAANYLGVSSRTLSNSRSSGVGVNINFIKIGGCVRYRISELDKYLDNHTFKHTGEII
jgi:excisionase family DNA binding protein